MEESRLTWDSEYELPYETLWGKMEKICYINALSMHMLKENIKANYKKDGKNFDESIIENKMEQSPFDCYDFWKKYICVNNDNDFCIILHACPNAIGKFQWYWMDEPNNEIKKNIEGEVYESITISSQQIKEKYINKWLACHCDVSDETYEEGCVYLTDNVIDMIRENQFDNISFYDEKGMTKANFYYCFSEQFET